MHLIDFPLQPFLDSFLHPKVLTFSSTALIILESFISSGDLVSIYPPEAPLELCTKLFLFSYKKICSRKEIEIPCLKEISDKLIG